MRPLTTKVIAICAYNELFCLSVFVVTVFHPCEHKHRLLTLPAAKLARYILNSLIH